MFYVKKKFEGGGEINIPIDYDNVFTACPGCGIEFEVDLSEFQDDDYDIYDTQVYCEKCSGNHSDSKVNEAEMNFSEKIQIIKETRDVMMENGKHPEDVAAEIKKLCGKFNIDPLTVLACGDDY